MGDLGGGALQYSGGLRGRAPQYIIKDVRWRQCRYEIGVKGGDVRLEFFAPRETRRGVSAKPWGRRSVFNATFMRGGKFPERVVTQKLSPHVWRRNNTAGTHITQAKSGLFIPTEAVKGASGKAWTTTGGPLLQQRVEAAIAKLLP